MRVTFMGESRRGVVGGAKPFMGAWMLLCHSLLTVLLIAVTASALNNTLPGCRPTCGDVSIPYPFGIDPDCFLPGFNLSCNKDNATGVQKPFIYNIELINISLLPAQARVHNQISWQCYNAKYHNVSRSQWYLNFINDPYRFSDADNKFTVVGCDTLAYIRGLNQKASYDGGCVTVCDSSKSLTNGSCSGIGCCQTSIPKGINYYEVTFDRNFNNSRVWKFNPCSYAVLAEANWFYFTTTYINSHELNKTNRGRAPIVLDWAIGNDTCEVAKRNTTSYACRSERSDCFNSSNGPGYICNCSRGYEGNPYLPDGCHDIDECALKYPCYGTCTNVPGDYNCTCLAGTNGDAKKEPCNPDQGSRSHPFSSVKLVIGIVGSTSLALLLLLCIVVSMVYDRRKLMRIKEEYFRRHGGRLLLEEIKSKQGLAFKVFTKQELEQATNNFDKNRILGGGGHGSVWCVRKNAISSAGESHK